MNDLDKEFLDSSNNLAKVFGELSNQPSEIFAQAEAMQKQAIAQMNHEIMIARIETAIVIIFACVIAERLWKWFHNTEKHLKDISAAVQRQDVTSKDQASVNQKQPETTSAVRESSFQNPDSKYMPKN